MPSSKPVVLKYCATEKRTYEEDALMFKAKNLLRWIFVAALLLFPFIFYVPLYFDDVISKESVDMELCGWGPNTSRSVSLYVTPDNETALISGQICSKGPFLLVVVCSAVNNTLERSAIRETWGNFSSPLYRIAFLVGTTDNATSQAAVEEESIRHGDVIQENFVDSYTNLTLKSIMLLKYVRNHCDQIEYVYKSDDDMFVHISNLLALLKLAKEKNLKNLLLGKVISGAKPISEANNKWYSPRYMYQEKVYPPYLSGTGYLMDRQTAVQLYEAALTIPYLHLEDVFITGLCARKAKIKPLNHLGFSFATRPLDPCLYMKNQNIITSHKVTVENMRQLWRSLNNGTVCPEWKKFVPVKLDFSKKVPLEGKGKRRRKKFLSNLIGSGENLGKKSAE